MSNAEPTPEQIEAVLTFAERGYLRELGALDPRHNYTADESAEMKARFRLYREGSEAFKSIVTAGSTAPQLTSTITEDQLCSLEMTAGSHGMRNALEAVGIAVGAPARNPGGLEVDEAKLYAAIDSAQRVWNSNGRHEPITAAITRAVLGEFGGGRGGIPDESSSTGGHSPSGPRRASSARDDRTLEVALHSHEAIFESGVFAGRCICGERSSSYVLWQGHRTHAVAEAVWGV